MRGRYLFPGFVLVVVLLSELSLANILHVSVVFRHGVRTHLSKNSDPLDGEGEARLLVPEGGDEARRLGTFIRNTYLTTEDDSMKIDQSEPRYTSIRDVKIVSSNLVRTTSTAAGFADGLYPDQAVPVTISALEEDDFLIRAYTKCPNFSDRLNDLYASEEFQNKERETRDFRTAWAPAFSEPTTLENWWNVFDKYNLALNYGSHNGRDVDVPEDVSLDEARNAFPEMQELAEWVELRRYSPDMVVDDVGGRLLGEIVGDIRRALDENQSPHRITAYSSHYPTILSLVSTMSGEMIGHIPNFGEAVIVELHDSGLRLGVYSQASSEIEYISVNEDLCDSDPPVVPCPFGALEQFFDASLLRDAAGACKACGNSEAPVCAPVDALPGATQSPTATATASPTPASEPQCGDGLSATAAGFIGAFVGLAFGGVAVAAVVYIRRRRSERSAVFGLEVGGKDAKDGYVPDVLAT
ncbi:hypothetical protein NDN08_004219 [Rhodosorus marinus]|uniref:Acid phosphatase n=1 Tax=Rhodosorus marinus TaxID=101924 RepID=A0AAV8ULM5_9RHOD|nr:hypothetical protein NDN08_004219 [Rhodosorus marinus]